MTAQSAPCSTRFEPHARGGDCTASRRRRRDVSVVAAAHLWHL
jgi:hypothetical protein